jgi:hypothetical protein
MKRGRWVLATGGLAGLVAFLIVTPFVRDQLLHFTRTLRERSEGQELAEHLVSTDSLLDYCVDHPDQVAIASWEIGAPAQGIYYNVARSQPASSASALLVLAAYAAAAKPDEHVPLAHWERYWLPGVDGGAHTAALLDARAAGAPSGDSARVLDVVRAMTRHADPAAMDLLIERLGRERLLQRVLGLGFSADAVPLPAAGVQLSLLTDAAAPELLARFRAQPRAAFADSTWKLFMQLRDDAAFRARSWERLENGGASFSLRETAELTDALAARGSAGAYARLMEQIARGELDGSAYVRSHLEQPLSAARREELELLAGVRGSQPGVYTSVSYGRARGTRVLSLMLHKLPLAVWLHLSSGYLLERFEADLLGDDAFFERARERLNGRVQPAAEANAEAGLHLSSEPTQVMR